MNLDDALVELQSWAGRSGREPDPDRRAEWAAILLPHDDQSWAQRYLLSKGAAIPTSTCALVGVRFLSLVGCTCNEHSTPYAPRLGQVVSDVERIARRHGAWRTGADLGSYPAPGDLLGMRPTNPHVAVVYGSRASDGAILSIDGGSRDNTWTDHRARRLHANGSLFDLDDGVAQRVGRESTLYARVDTGEILATLENCR